MPVLLRALFLVAIVASLATAPTKAVAQSAAKLERVDPLQAPWAAIGRVNNSTGATCSGVLVAPGRALTAAHCLFNRRTGRFMQAESIHFLLGYDRGAIRFHARAASFRIGEGYDPKRAGPTLGSDWAVLTLEKEAPAGITPMRVAEGPAGPGTDFTVAGYGRQRLYVLTADRSCRILGRASAGRILASRCASPPGFSGSPLFIGPDDAPSLVGIQVAAMEREGERIMLAVPASAFAVAIGE